MNDELLEKLESEVNKRLEYDKGSLEQKKYEEDFRQIIKDYSKSYTEPGRHNPDEKFKMDELEENKKEFLRDRNSPEENKKFLKLMKENLLF